MMSFLPSPMSSAVESSRPKHGLRAKDRRQTRFPLLVLQLEERQLLTTPTLLSISASTSNLAAGAMEVFTATAVTNPPDGNNLPTGGTVTFSNGALTLGSAPLINGLASFSTTLGPGTYSVTASYSGAAAFASSSTTSSAGFIFNQAGNGTFGSTDLSSGTVQATAAELSNPFGVAVGPTGTIYIADTFNDVIDAVNPSTGVITVIAGTLGVNGPASAGLLYDPRGIALDGNLMFIADRDNNAVEELNLTTGNLTTIAGNGTFGDAGDGGPATAAELASPTAVAVDSTGQNVYIADTFNDAIRKVNLASGIITTVAGTLGTSGFSGNGGPATAATLFDPSGVVVDGSGNIYIADSDNEVVREVNASTGIISTFAGTAQTIGFSGDGGLATSATLSSPWGLALNSTGTTLYIADRDNNAIRQVNLATGIITTLAGTGTFGSTGDGGPATAATLSSPRSIAVDTSGNVYIADALGNQIRMVAFGSASASVTVAAFATKQPSRSALFSPTVPTGTGGVAQAVNLTVSNNVNVGAIVNKGNYSLALVGKNGRATKIKIRRVLYTGSALSLSVFPGSKLLIGNPLRTYRLIIRGQAFGTLTITFNKWNILSETV
jgi:sugar lactone lactonase YvrE